MNPISPKVAAAGGAAGVSTPLSMIVIWALGLLHVTVPPEIGGAIASLIAALAAVVAGYLVPHQAPPAPANP